MRRLIDVERVLEPYKILRNTDTLCVATIRQNILECSTVEAISKDQYETCLKADMAAMLTDIQKEIKELNTYDIERTHGLIEDSYVTTDVSGIIQLKIEALKAESESQESEET